MSSSRKVSLQQAAYLLTNLVSACAIVFANKAVLSVLQFKFTVALTCIHTVVTFAAARLLRASGRVVPNKLPKRAIVPLAAAFTGYIVLCNVSLALNTVGFYQLTKIAIAPTVLLMESVSRRQFPDVNVTVGVLVVCFGIGLATVSDMEVMTNLPGLVVGIISVFVSAQYGIWIGSITKHHKITSMQLLDQYISYAALMLTLCVPVEDVIIRRNAISDSGPVSTLWTFPYTVRTVSTIVVSAVLGVFVTFSTFLVIEHTSPLTYAVAGHVKTIVIIIGGALIFHDHVTTIKAAGITIALAGVVGYTYVRMSAASPRVTGLKA
jgi:solute carrier family 35, member E3